MQKYFAKLYTKERSPLKVNFKDSLIGLIGGFITIGLLAYLTKETKTPWIIAPFGASCVLAFGAWNAPLSQPRNIIGGHIIATTIGILCYNLLGNTPISLALGVGISIFAMLLTKTTHPPAGADPLVVIVAGSSWSFLIHPLILGCLVIVILAIIINNLSNVRKYPELLQ